MPNQSSTRESVSAGGDGQDSPSPTAGQRSPVKMVAKPTVRTLDDDDDQILR